MAYILCLPQESSQSNKRGGIPRMHSEKKWGSQHSQDRGVVRAELGGIVFEGEEVWRRCDATEVDKRRAAIQVARTGQL